MLVDAALPVSFFAYPGKASDLVPPGCAVHHLAGPADDAVATLAALVDALDAPRAAGSVQAAGRPERPTGALTAETVCAALGALLPEGAIVSDEGNTSGLFAAGATAGAPPHDWLCLTGGAIGQGLPVAVGAAVACPGRKVIALQADGSALYTVQALWTQALEKLDVITVLLSNRRYEILFGERAGAGASVGPASRELFSLGKPDLGWTKIAEGFGVEAARAETLDQFADLFAAANRRRGPFLIELVVP